MNRPFFPIIAAALLAACHHNSPNANVYPAGSPSASANGDVGRRGPGRGEEMLLRGITLTSDQQQRIDAIRANYRAQIDPIRQQSNGDRSAMRERVRPLMEKQMAEIRAVLTDDQQKQFDQNVAEMRARGPRQP